MTDLRNVTIPGLMGRINTLLDAGEAALTPPDVDPDLPRVPTRSP
jgi:hypothetical protein